MAEDILFEHFDLLADTPGGVQKLRELILQLAIQGILVPQDPEDSPASELLKEIDAEKQRLVKEGKIKKQKPLPEIKPEEVPFELPEGWEWVRLGMIVNRVHYGYTASADSNLREPKLLRITDIQSNKVDWKNVPGCKIDQNSLYRYSLQEGDILVARTGGTIGKSYLIQYIDVNAVFASYLIRIIPNNYLFSRYIKFFFESPLYWTQLYDRSMGTGQPNVNGTALKLLVVSLPPLPEQQRIVAKVDQLMALCDDLEAKKEKQKATHDRLNKSALQTLRESKTNDDLAANWTRVKNNFRQLFTTPESVQELRSTILQLAVQGRLVPQNQQDEPASALLERVREEKQRLVKEGKIKRQKPLPKIKPEEVPFELPEGWEWVRLGSTGVCGTGKTPKTSYREFYDGGEVPFIGPGQVTEQGYIIDSDKYITKKAVEHSNIAKCKDILMVCIGGSIGKCAIVRNKVAFNQQINCISPLLVNFRYVFHAMRSSIFQSDLLSKSTGSATPIINRLKWEELKIPLPPLSEQSRIVSKVDQLMAMSDELESGLFQSQAEGEKLMASVVENISGSRQESDAKFRNPANRSPDEVVSNTNHRMADTPPAKPQPANTAPPTPVPSTARFSNHKSDKTKSNNTAAAILAYMMPGEQYTRSDIMDALDLNVSAWNTGIRELKEKGYVVQTGEKRGARYSLSERER